MKNRPEIDGLRALAVLPVLLFHADLGFSGGFVGVDVFFVISGFLITGLILQDLERGQFHLLYFWERRVRRILPALATVVLSTLVAGWFLLLPQDFKQLGRSATAQALLLSNVYFWRDSGYFAQAAELKPLLHTWSLAVEEQFYLCFPFLLIALKRLSHKSLVRTLVLLLLASLGLSICGSYSRFASATFYLLPARAWELLLGSLLATLPFRVACPPWLKEALSWSGLLAILCAVFCYDSKTPFPGYAALLPCVGTALVIWSNTSRLTSAGRLLATRPFVFVGLISYSLYLWHWPVLVFSKYWALEPLSILHRLLLLVSSVILAGLSWRFVEAPFRQRIIFQQRAHVFAFASIVTGLLFLSGLAIDRKAGIPSRLPPEVRQYADASTNKAFLREIVLNEALQEDFVKLGTGNKNQPVSMLVWGDSHAMAVMPVIDDLCRNHSLRAIGAAHSFTPPLLGYESDDRESLQGDSIPYNQAILDWVRRKRVNHVLLVAYWSFYLNADNGPDRLRRGLLATISALQESGANVWVLRQVPKHRWNVPKALASTVLSGGNPAELGLPIAEQLKAFHSQDAIFEGLAARGVTVLDPTSFFFRPPDLYRAAADGKALYYDSHHLTIDGAMLLRPLFDPLWSAISKDLTPARAGVLTD